MSCTPGTFVISADHQHATLGVGETRDPFQVIVSTRFLPLNVLMLLHKKCILPEQCEITNQGAHRHNFVVLHLTEKASTRHIMHTACYLASSVTYRLAILRHFASLDFASQYPSCRAPPNIACVLPMMQSHKIRYSGDTPRSTRTASGICR